MPTYRASCITQLTIRFDPSLSTQDVTQQFNPGSATQTQVVTSGTLPQNQTTPSAQTNETYTNPFTDTQSADGFTHVLNIQPREGSVELAGLRHAGTFDMKFGYEVFPVDPRTVLAIGVAIYFGCVDVKVFADAVGSLNAAWVQMPNIVKAQKEVFCGNVDVWTVTHDSKGGSEMELKGRDLSGSFHDAKLPYWLVKDIKLDRPLDQVLTDILNATTAITRVKIKLRAFVDSQWGEGGIPVVAEPATLARHLKGAKGGDVSTRGTGDRRGVWDLITWYCYICGAIPRFEGQELVVSRARDVFRTPYPLTRSQAFATGESFSRKIDVTTVKSLKFEKKYQGTLKRPTIVVRSVDETRKGLDKIVQAQWPTFIDNVKGRANKQQVEEEARESFEYDPTAQRPNQTPNIAVKYVPGIRDVEKLQEIARGIYEEIGRQEIEGTCETRELASWIDPSKYAGLLPGDDPDLLRLKIGDDVTYILNGAPLTAVAPQVSVLIKQYRDPQGAVQALRKMGYASQLASLLVKLAQGDLFQTGDARAAQPRLATFRVCKAHYKWEVDKGIHITFDFQNFIETSFDTQDPAPARTSTFKEAQTKHPIVRNPTRGP